MGMSFGYGPRKSEEENSKVLTRAADMGVTFWDTADVYGYGHNEGSLPRLNSIDFRNAWEVVQNNREGRMRFSSPQKIWSYS
jgi:predicted oxidoreductase